MPEPYRVEPDGKFVRRILDEGGGNLKQCFQCATCSVVCSLSPDRRPFPRKEMIWTQWGLRDKLFADPDVWRCYQCDDCSTYCPRGARPGDVLAAVRREAVEHYAAPRFLARLVNDVKALPVMLLIPAALLGGALLLKTPLEKVLPAALKHEVPAGTWEYAQLFPHWLLIGFFTFFSILSFLAMLAGVVKFWKAMRAADERAGLKSAGGNWSAAAIKVGRDIFTHEKFSQCTTNASRRLSHLGVFYGFLGLLLVTIWAIFVLYVFKYLKPGLFEYPFAFWNPAKILANASMLALGAGCVLMMRDRLRKDSEEKGRSSSFDWVFVGTLAAVTLTGFAVEVSRFADLRSVGYGVYFVHLVCVFALLIYLPYSKFAHLVYRAVALFYSEYTGRDEIPTAAEKAASAKG